jgi:hypothetical protein
MVKCQLKHVLARGTFAARLMDVQTYGDSTEYTIDDDSLGTDIESLFCQNCGQWLQWPQVKDLTEVVAAHLRQSAED